MPDEKPERPVRLIKVPHEVEAAIIIAALSARGIDAHSTGEHTSSLRAEAPGMVQVWVHSADLEPAGQILETIKQESAEIDWTQVDIGDPTLPEDEE